MKKGLFMGVLLGAFVAQAQAPSSTTGGCPFGFDKMGAAQASSAPASVSHATSAATPETDDPKAMTAKDFRTNRDWWPNQLDLSVLRQNGEESNPYGPDFNYREKFTSLDYDALKADIRQTLTDSKEWWPADWGHYGGLFIRMAWHSAGTYRTADGRGGTREGQQRFAPQNSWPDNANLDKARRLLWPVKQKYGAQISWADLMILAGNVAFEDMGFETIGFAGGREDIWEPAGNVYWGPEEKWLDDERYSGDRQLEDPLAAVQMGLIYVNPEGPNGNPDPVAAARDIRETFGRMGMNDEETVALIAGGHTLGKTHGMSSTSYMGAEPEGAAIQEQGLGWTSSYKSGVGPDATTSGLEVIWTPTPTIWNHDYFKMLFENEWELVKSPGGANQWTASNSPELMPDAFDSNKKYKPTMLTTDLSLRFDAEYEKISRRFYENPKEFDEAFARAWFKLTHRDLGPKSLYLGPEAPKEDFLWQDPIPALDYELASAEEITALKAKIKSAGHSSQALIRAAWASASTFRGSDYRGGANGGRIRLEPQRNWEVNSPEELASVLNTYEQIKKDFDTRKKKISIADLVVLGGNVGVEMAAAAAGYDVEVPFTGGRTDASQDQTDISSQAVLEPIADGFRNYKKGDYTFTTEELLVDKAQLLTLTAPEMTVLLGGMRAVGANYDGSNHGVFTKRVGALSNDFFVNLLSMEVKWEPINDTEEVFQGRDRKSGEVLWTATRADLIFGSNSELRAIAEVYAAQDAQQKMVTDFIAAWNKVMNLNLFNAAL